jgi:hypothetical protein
MVAITSGCQRVEDQEKEINAYQSKIKTVPFDPVRFIRRHGDSRGLLFKG